MYDQPLRGRRNSRGQYVPAGDDTDSERALSPKTPFPDYSRAARSYIYGLWWKWELLGAVASVVTLLALVITLRALDGEPEQMWGHITLNTIAAVLATVMSASLTAVISSAMSQNLWNWMANPHNGHADRIRRRRVLKDMVIFDRASRGPLGGAMLIWRMYGWHPACIGALLMILNLGLGAFAQLAVTDQPNHVRIGPAAPFQRSISYAPVPFKSEPSLPADQQDTMDLYTRTTIFAAMMGNGAKDLNPSCPTSDCTYPITPTLGICGACTDISNQLNDTGSCPLNDDDGQSCSYKLPNGANYSFTYGGDPANDLEVFKVINLVPGIQYPFEVSESFPFNFTPIVYNDSKTEYAVVFETIGIPANVAYSWFGGDDRSKFPPIQAHECALWWCLQAYNVSVTPSSINKVLVQTWTEMDPENGTFVNIPKSMNTDPDDVYVVTATARKGIAEGLVIGGNGTTNSGSGASVTNGLPIVQFGALHGEGVSYGNGGDQLEGMWMGSEDFHNPKHTGWIDVLAHSLSTNIAVTNPDNSSQYDGVAMQVQNVFAIRWVFLIFPILVLALGLVFLVTTILETHRKMVRPWKTGILPLLLMSVDKRIQDQAAALHALETPDGMERIGDLDVRLRQREPGKWNFVSTLE